MDLATIQNPRDDEDVRELVEQCLLSTQTCAKVLFPERFTLPFSAELHGKIFDFIDNNPSQLLAISAPRGIGKTSILNLVYPAKCILFRLKKFIMTVSASNEFAVQQTENLKHELLTNPNIVRLFGPMKSSEFSKTQWVTSSGTMVYPRGSGQQVRGALYRNHRPDLILVDDLEDDEAVLSEERRYKLKDWFFGSLMQCVNRADPNWRIIVMGTILHEDSLLMNLLEDKDNNWATLRLEICDDNYNSKWPEQISTEEVKALANRYRSQGKLDAFYREMRGIPISLEDPKFPRKFKYFQNSDLVGKVLESFVIVDPARTTEKGSADTAIVGVSVDLMENKIYIRDLICTQLHPHEQIDQAIRMAESIGAKAIGVEVTGLNEFIMHPFKDRMLSLGKFFELHALKARDKKENRVERLAHYYRLGQIYHNEAVCGPLEAQLMMFPRPKKWDAADATAYIPEMLELGERYFFQPSSMPDNPEFIEREYAELEADEFAEGPLPDIRII